MKTENKRSDCETEAVMELLKKNIHMSKLKGKLVTQITLDEDFNVPDTKPDISRMILKQGEIALESVKQSEEKVQLKGKLLFDLLYGTEEGSNHLQNFHGFAPFDEITNYNGLETSDHVRVRAEIEDMTISLINSRKIRVNAILTFEIRAESMYDEAAAQSVSGEDSVQTLTKNLEVMQVRVQRKDTFRVKEEIELSGNKPNIDHLLWRGLSLRSVECRPIDGKLSLRGEMVLFVLYAGEEEHIPMQWLEKNIGFSGEIDVPECKLSMISATNITLLHKEIEAKPDYDGENRIITFDAVLELDMKLYEEENIQILADVYSPVKEVIPQYSQANFEGLLVRNSAKCKVVDKINVSEEEKILQICHSEGCVKIDRTIIVDDGIKVEGAITVTSLYMAADDQEPLRSLAGAVPFSHIIEAKGIDDSCVFELTSGIEQLTTVMLGNNEVEVRASLTLDALVLSKISQPMPVNVQILPLNEEKMEELPGIVGYIVRPGDCLWDIAKKFYTTIEVMKETNGLTSDIVKPGDRLLLIKKTEEL